MTEEIKTIQKPYGIIKEHYKDGKKIKVESIGNGTAPIEKTEEEKFKELTDTQKIEFIAKRLGVIK